jgi:hypothetical protein
LFPQRVYTLSTCVGLIEYAIAGAAGAYLYKEV